MSTFGIPGARIGGWHVIPGYRRQYDRSGYGRGAAERFRISIGGATVSMLSVRAARSTTTPITRHIYGISLAPRRLTQRSSPTTMWSSTAMPRISPALMTRRVLSRSSRVGAIAAQVVDTSAPAQLRPDPRVLGRAGTVGPALVVSLLRGSGSEIPVLFRG